MSTIERKDVMNMVAIMCAGIFANPVSGDVARDQYARQQIIQQTLSDTQFVIQAAGITIIEPDENITES